MVGDGHQEAAVVLGRERALDDGLDHDELVRTPEGAQQRMKPRVAAHHPTHVFQDRLGHLLTSALSSPLS